MIFHAYNVPGQIFAASAMRGQYSVWTPAGGAISRAAALPLPVAIVLWELAAAWQSCSLNFVASVQVLLNSVATGKAVAMSGASGFGVPLLDVGVAAAAGDVVDFLFTVSQGTVGTFQVSMVGRPFPILPKQQTHARAQMGYPTAYFPFIDTPGQPTNEAIDGVWLGLGTPLLSGFLVPVPVVMTNLSTEVTANSLNADSLIAVWDTLNGVLIDPNAQHGYGPANTGQQNSGPFVAPIAAGKVLVVRGISAATTGSMPAPVRLTALLSIA